MSSSSDTPPANRLGNHLLHAARQDSASWQPAQRPSQYVVTLPGEEQRTMTLAQIVAAYHEEIVDADSYIWAEGMEDWLPLKDVDPIVDALYEAEAAGGSDPADDGASQQPVAQPAGFFTMGGSTDRNPRAAEQRSPSTDDSAIFALDKLMADAAPSSSPSGSAQGEDSGLIDLKALSSGLSAPAPSPLLGPWDAGGVFPLGQPALDPAPIPVAAPSSAPAARTTRWLTGALGAAVVVLAAVTVFLVVRDTARPPASTAVAASSMAPELTTAAADRAGTATPVARAQPSAEPTVTTTATSTVAPAPTAVAMGRPPTRGHSSPTPTATAPPAKDGSGPKNDCRCPKDDLMCFMRCRVKR